MKAMLLAAGLGTRFQPQTLKKAKPALPFLNMPMAYYSVFLLNQLGLTNFVYNTFHLPETVKAVFTHNARETQEIQSWLKQSNFVESKDGLSILGSAGGLKKAEANFVGHDDLLLMNADEIILPNDLETFEKLLIAHHQNSHVQDSQRLGTLAVMKHPEVGNHFGGIWSDQNHRVIEIGKKPSRPDLIGWHFIGLQILNSKIFSLIPNGIESNIFYDVLNPLLKNYEVYVHPVDCQWFETGNLQSYLHATEECLKFIDTKSHLYLLNLLKTLRPTDHVVKLGTSVIYGNLNFLEYVSPAKINQFAVGTRTTSIKPNEKFNGEFSRVVVGADLALQLNAYSNDLLI